MRPALAACAIVVVAAFGVWLSTLGRQPLVADTSVAASAPASPAAAPVPTPLPVLPGSPKVVAREPLDEASLMARLGVARETDAALTIALERDGNRRFPDSPLAVERASILIHALAGAGRSSEARGEAEDAVNRYPDSSWVREIEQFTGAHRHRNLRRNDAGQLEYY